MPGSRIQKYVNVGKYMRRSDITWLDTPAVGGLSGLPALMTGVSL